MRFRQVAIEQEKRELSSFGLVGRSHVHVADGSHTGDVVGRRFHKELERRAASKLERPTVGIINGLSQETILVGHDRSDDVDELRQASELYALCLANERIDQTSDQE